MKTKTGRDRLRIDEGGSGSGCYYWNREMNICSVRREGLFMPMTQQICTYCQTANYPYCSYYHLFERPVVKPARNTKRKTACSPL
mgnify:CR=1 FL=1